MSSALNIGDTSVRDANSGVVVDSKDKLSPGYLKRREQVRKAQRTHRERKETYIKALENRVIELRKEKMHIVQENQALTMQVARLRGAVDKVNASTWVPNSTDNDSDVWLNNMHSSPTNIDVESIQIPTEGEQNCELQPMNGGVCSTSRPDVSWFYNTVSLSTECSTAVSRRSFSKMNLSSVNQTQLAVDFVLGLEKPCRYRTQSAIFSPSHKQPRVDVASDMHAVKYHSFLEDRFLDLDSESSASLDHLLSLSSAFCLKDKVTPIQAWQQIVTHPEFEYLEYERLRWLVEELLEHVRCYGFGAVIETRVFKMLFGNMFTKGRL